MCLATICCTCLLYFSVHWDAIFRSDSSKQFQVRTDLNPNVGVLRLFPGITDATVCCIQQKYFIFACVSTVIQHRRSHHVRRTKNVRHETKFSHCHCLIFHVYSWKRHRLVERCQFYRLVATCQFQQSSCRLVATCHLQTRYNLLKQLAASLWITSFDNKLAANLLTACNRLVINKLSQAMGTHPDIGLLMTSLLQDVNRLVASSLFLVIQ